MRGSGVPSAQRRSKRRGARASGGDRVPELQIRAPAAARGPARSPHPTPRPSCSPAPPAAAADQVGKSPACQAAPTPGTPRLAFPASPRSWIPFFIPGDPRAQIAQPSPRESGVSLPALRVPSQTLGSRADRRLAPPPGPRSLELSSALGTPPGLGPPPRPSPESPGHPPRPCHTPRARAARPRSRPHGAPFAHPVCPSPALRFQPPAASPGPGRPAATLDTGPLWSCPWSARSAASPPPPPAATARKGAPAARGDPPCRAFDPGIPRALPDPD